MAAATGATPVRNLPDPRSYELSAAQRAATEQLFQSTLATLATERWCAHCRRPYRDWDALGRFPCRGHPGVYDFRHDAWGCCGRAGALAGVIDGCVPADHTDASRPAPVHTHGIAQRAAVPLPVFLGMPDRPRRHIASIEHVPGSGYRPEYGGWTEDDAEDALEEQAIPPSYRQFDPESVRLGLDHAEDRGDEDELAARRRARTVLEWAPGLNLADVQVLLYRTGQRGSAVS